MNDYIDLEDGEEFEDYLTDIEREEGPGIMNILIELIFEEKILFFLYRVIRIKLGLFRAFCSCNQTGD